MRKDVGPGANPDFVLGDEAPVRPRADEEDHRARPSRWSANDQPIDPTNRFYFAGLPQRPFDPEKAEVPPAEVGVTGKVPVVASPAALYSVEMALVMQQDRAAHRARTSTSSACRPTATGRTTG
jgi:peptide/nickel transport system substrate-binding protein